jgi:hypothetical protein
MHAAAAAAVPLLTVLVIPGFQGVQAANSSWLNSARVKKESLRNQGTTDAQSQHTPGEKSGAHTTHLSRHTLHRWPS